MSYTYRQWMHDGTSTKGVPFWAVTLNGYASNPSLKFFGDGSITTSKGNVAFDADIAALAESIQSIITAQAVYMSNEDTSSPNPSYPWTIQRSYDPTTPSGYRYRLSGLSPLSYGEEICTVTYPMVLSGVFPGAYGVTNMYVQAPGNIKHNDNGVGLVSIPSTSSMNIMFGAYSDGGYDDFPARGAWWVEGW